MILLCQGLWCVYIRLTLKYIQCINCQCFFVFLFLEGGKRKPFNDIRQFFYCRSRLIDPLTLFSLYHQHLQFFWAARCQVQTFLCLFYSLYHSCHPKRREWRQYRRRGGGSPYDATPTSSWQPSMNQVSQMAMSFDHMLEPVLVPSFFLRTSLIDYDKSLLM